MTEYASAELDMFARAFERALAAAPDDFDAETKKALLVSGIMGAAGRGVRDENILTDAALAALALYDAGRIQVAMTAVPL
jgi:hypothetical protein